MEGAEGHRERIRQRANREGLDHFQDYEVLEYLLTHYIPRIDTKPIAKRLMAHYGSLYRVLEATPEDLQKIQGIGAVSANAISLLPQIFRRYRIDRWKERKTLMTYHEVGVFCEELFISERYEVCKVILLNNKGGLMQVETTAKGTIDQVAIYSRNIAELALRHDAKLVIIAHNHPGGSARPSDNDIEITHKVRAALDLMDIQLLDHVIVAGSGYLSINAYVQEREEVRRSKQESVRQKKPTGKAPWIDDEDRIAAEDLK